MDTNQREDLLAAIRRRVDAGLKIDRAEALFLSQRNSQALASLHGARPADSGPIHIDTMVVQGAGAVGIDLGKR